jgi:hypothetical protein
MVARPVLDRTSDYPLKRSWCPRFLRCDFGPTGPLDSVRQRSRSVRARSRISDTRVLCALAPAGGDDDGRRRAAFRRSAAGRILATLTSLFVVVVARMISSSRG